MQPIPDLGNGDVLTEEFTQNVKANFDGLASSAESSGASLVTVETGTLPGSGGDVQSVLEAQKQINEENGGLIAVNTALREELASTDVGSGGSMVAFDTTTHSTSGDDVQEVVDSLLTALGLIEAASQPEAETKTNLSKYISPGTARGAAGSASTETAGESVDGSSTPQAVYISDGSDGDDAGKYYKSDADGFAAASNKFDGFVKGNKSADQTDLLINSGIIDGFTGLTPGADYYIHTTAGAITTTNKGVLVGRAISATEIRIRAVEGAVSIDVLATVASLAQNTTHSVDTVVTTGFRPRFIEIEYKLFGYGGGAGKFAHGKAIFEGTTLIAIRKLCDNQAAATAISPSTMSAPNSTTPATAGESDGDEEVLTTFALLSVSDTGYTIRTTFTKNGSGAASSNGDAFYVAKASRL